ncbi:universal stress protein [[Actinomadura] parvosata]|uniref:universal stress protein n=1 Tax=[Actinomadura] parvosata TaxID=1955412 RepID=UPI0009ABC385|nr:universal stress protein [Nonomuraea sp. ATCC 55076]
MNSDSYRHLESDSRPRVLVALDGSLAGFAALRHAVGEARRRGAHLYAIRVLPGAGVLPGLDDDHDLFLLMREGVWTSVREALGEVPADIEMHALVARGSPGPALVGLAHRDNDLLVLGGGEGNWLRRWRGAATSRYCVTHCRCPVLTVPLPPSLQALYRSRGRRREWGRLLEG